jgi:hybrid polyketide synthase/nonribosomal peptide synthetase ACE1
VDQIECSRTQTCCAENAASVKPTHFLDLTAHSRIHPSDLSLSIAQTLPSPCKRIEPSDLFQRQALLPLSFDREALVGRFEDAVAGARTSVVSITQERVQDMVLQLNQIHDRSMPNYPTSVVHWPVDGEVRVEVRPLDARSLFPRTRRMSSLVSLAKSDSRFVAGWYPMEQDVCA